MLMRNILSAYQKLVDSQTSVVVVSFVATGGVGGCAGNDAVAPFVATGSVGGGAGNGLVPPFASIGWDADKDLLLHSILQPFGKRIPCQAIESTLITQFRDKTMCAIKTRWFTIKKKGLEK